MANTVCDPHGSLQTTHAFVTQAQMAGFRRSEWVLGADWKCGKAEVRRKTTGTDKADQ